LGAVIAILRQVSAPFIQAAVMETIKQSGRLLIDVDLTGRPVSPTSQDYAEADFGWLDDAVGKGYQAAITSLVGERWQRLLLTLQRYPGRTERPHSRLAKACRHLAAAQKRESRAWGDLHKIEGRIARQQQTIDEHQAALLSLEAWSVSLDTDNRANPNPVPMVVRLDAGFSTGLNLTWLIEMGYTV
jgi:hypothetical protein